MKVRQKVRSGVILFSFFLFPATFYYLSPVLIIEAGFNGIINGSFIFFIILFLSSLLFGRGYCGWICPAAGCQESLFLARDRKVLKGDLIKWFIWIPWIGGIIFAAYTAGGYQSIDFLYRTTYGFSIGDFQGLITYMLVLFLLIVFPGFLFGKRSFYHHLCWMAPFMIIGRKIRNIFNWNALHLSLSGEKCLHCHTCTEKCPMSLPVERMVKAKKMEMSECILCGTCADGCRESVIELSWKRK